MNRFQITSAIFSLLATLTFGCQASNLSAPDAQEPTGTTEELMRDTMNMTEAELLKLGTNGPPQIEVDAEGGIISLTTVSTGCTRPEHFTIAIDGQGKYVGTRIKPDRCRRRAFVVTYDYPLDSLPEPQ